MNLKEKGRRLLKDRKQLRKQHQQSKANLILCCNNPLLKMFKSLLASCSQNRWLRQRILWQEKKKRKCRTKKENKSMLNSQNKIAGMLLLSKCLLKSKSRNFNVQYQSFRSILDRKGSEIQICCKTWKNRERR